MIIDMDRGRRIREVEVILTDPLTCEQPFKAIVRYTGIPETTVRRVYRRMVRDGRIADRAETA